MLKNLLIFALCIVGIKASELYIVKSPDSLAFKGDEKLDSTSMGDVVAGSMGYFVDDGTKWSGLVILDPFATPKFGLVLHIDGIDQLTCEYSKVKTYLLAGSGAGESLNAVSSDLDSYNISTITLDLEQLSEAIVTSDSIFGTIAELKAPVKSTNSLKPDLHSEDRDFLTKIAYIKEVIKKYLTSDQKPTLLNIFVSVDPISKAHGRKSAAMVEAQKLICNLLEMFSEAKDTLVIAVAEKQDLYRSKREAVEGESAKSLNLAAYYNEDYPVIFNIILWFMVVLGFSVLAICYAIGSMDPGRDSIIYRMTSTRMKKDN